MTKKIANTIIAIFATLVGLYPLTYFLVDRKFGLLQSKTAELLSNAIWNTAFYAHITLGGVGLLVGWTQFSEKRRSKRLNLHRNIGKIYVIAVLISAVAGIYIALYATGGWIAASGFVGLGLTWFATTLTAFLKIKRGNVEGHQRMMIYSYAACLAAVTLRIYLPILTSLFGDFIKAYSIVSWLCWLPNIMVAFFIAKRIKKPESPLIKMQHPNEIVLANANEQAIT